LKLQVAGIEHAYWWNSRCFRADASTCDSVRIFHFECYNVNLAIVSMLVMKVHIELDIGSGCNLLRKNCGLVNIMMQSGLLKLCCNIVQGFEQQPT